MTFRRQRSNRELLLRGLPAWLSLEAHQPREQRSTGLALAPVDWRVSCERGLGLVHSLPASAEFGVGWTALSRTRSAPCAESVPASMIVR